MCHTQSGSCPFPSHISHDTVATTKCNLVNILVRDKVKFSKALYGYLTYLVGDLVGLPDGEKVDTFRI